MAKIALLIGVSEYEPGLNPLPAAIKDAEAMQRVLQDPEMGGFSEVKTLTNPDSQAMQYEIETLFSGRTKDDLVLLFFSGHGIKDDGGKLYFATRITRKNIKGDLIRSTAVPASFVHEIMNNSRARRQAIILDCCFSGAFDPALQAKDDGSVDLQSQLGAEGRVVLTSSSSTQYSFEQQGSNLSIYTRYLVEGIETGAGDHDEDGKISMRELHEYATSKVHEAAPNMTPKLITLKDMGFEIVLAKAKVTDPKLRYRKEVQKRANHAEISPVGRMYLDTLRTQLGLSPQVTTEIENEVLRPYRQRLDNLQQYRQAFKAAIEYEYPLGEEIIAELSDLRQILGLRKEDIAPIEAEEIANKTVTETEVHRNSLQRYEQEFLKVVQSEYPLSETAHNRLRELQNLLGLKQEDIEIFEKQIIKQKQQEYQLQQAELLKQQREDQKSAPQTQTDRSSNQRHKTILVVVSVCFALFSIMGISTFLIPRTDIIDILTQEKEPELTPSGPGKVSPQAEPVRAKSTTAYQHVNQFWQCTCQGEFGGLCPRSAEHEVKTAWGWSGNEKKFSSRGWLCERTN